MASMWDKLTGKAPWVEDPEEDEDDEALEEAEEAEDGTEDDAADEAEDETEDEIEDGDEGPRFRFGKKKQVAAHMKERAKDRSYLKAIGWWMIPMGACLVLLLLSLGVDGLMNNDARAQIARNTLTIQDNANKILTAKADIAAAESQKSQDEGRMVWAEDTHVEDDAAASAFFQRYMTWSNSAEYKALRDEFQIMYPGDSNALNCLFPEQWSYQDPNTLDVRDYIDREHLNLKFDRLTAYRLGSSVSTAAVSYGAIVLANRDADTFGSSTQRLAFYAEYDILDGAVALHNIYQLSDMKEY